MDRANDWVDVPFFSFNADGDIFDGEPCGCNIDGQGTSQVDEELEQWATKEAGVRGRLLGETPA